LAEVLGLSYTQGYLIHGKIWYVQSTKVLD